MYLGKSVAVVVPAHNEETQIALVIETMPACVDHIVVVDDVSDDRTAAIVGDHVASDPERVILLELEVNQGVGGAIARGYEWARDHDIDLCAVMAGDGQMDPADLEDLLDPVARGQVDYSKGNRLFHGEAWEKIPRIRYLGNSGLSLLTKIASGYWHVADSQTGYTVASLQVLQTLDLQGIYKRYGMPNDVLVKLNIDGFRVCDVPIRPVYGIGERSGIKLHKVFFSIPWLLTRLFFRRMLQRYVIRDFHPLVLFYFLGVLLLLAVLPLAGRLFYLWSSMGQVPQITALAILFCTSVGFQCLLFAMLFDMEANKDLKGTVPALGLRAAAHRVAQEASHQVETSAQG